MSETPKEYIHKPTVVEAWQISETNLQQVAGWCKGRVKGTSVVFPKIRDRSKLLGSTDNNHYALPGDYVVRSGKGFVRVKQADFEKLYVQGRTRAES